MTTLSEQEIERTGTVAVSKWSRIMLTSPRAMRLGYEWQDSLAHELVHYAVAALTHDRAPVWLQEGLGKFLEHRWRAPAGLDLGPSLQHLLAKALQSGKLIGFEAMHPVDGQAAARRGRGPGVRRSHHGRGLPVRPRRHRGPARRAGHGARGGRRHHRRRARLRRQRVVEGLRARLAAVHGGPALQDAARARAHDPEVQEEGGHRAAQRGRRRHAASARPSATCGSAT